MRLFYLILIFFIFLPSPGFSAKWTVMVYMAADNDLADAALFDIQEMESVGSTEDVNIVVQVDINPIYTLSSDPTTHRLYIQKNGTIEDFPLNTDIDSSNPQNLTNFITWAVSNYPAEHYMLVLWDHGGGWKRKGILEDDDTDSVMSIDEVKNAILASGIKFDVIDFDACLMGMYEVAYTLKDCASYLVFSEETEPSEGDAYDDFLNKLVQNPDISSIELSKQVVLSYYNYYVQKNEQYPVTKSVCDLSVIDELHTKLQDFVSLAKSNISSIATYISISSQNTQSFATPSYKDMYDLFFNFKTELQSSNMTDALNLIDNILNTIKNRLIPFYRVYNPHLSYSMDIFNINSLDRAHGISIYFPDPGSLDINEIDQYSLLDLNREQNSWYDFIRSLLDASNNYQPIATSSGKFSWAIAWLDAFGNFPSYADVDLYIVEPCSGCIGGVDIFAPYMGVSTPNGHFSPDSSDTNPYLSVETYTSNDRFHSGTYIAIAALNCYGGYNLWNMEYGYADVIFYKSDETTDYEYKFVSENILDCSNPAPPMEYWTENTIYGIVYGFYTNWWIIHVENKSSIRNLQGNTKRFGGN